MEDTGGIVALKMPVDISPPIPRTVDISNSVEFSLILAAVQANEI